MSILAWIIIGLFAGLIARAIYPGRQSMGLLSTTLLGVVGALIGGIVGRACHPVGLRALMLGWLTGQQVVRLSLKLGEGAFEPHVNRRPVQLALLERPGEALASSGLEVLEQQEVERVDRQGARPSCVKTGPL
jgi:uncharacterized membrane protein YeaQ/YmgE (transglycosylase-associated protein family)